MFNVIKLPRQSISHFRCTATSLPHLGRKHKTKIFKIYFRYRNLASVFLQSAPGKRDAYFYLI